MTKAIRMFCIFMAFILSSLVSEAQTPGGGGAPDPQARNTQVARELGLTDAQRVQFDKIVEEERAGLMASMKQEREQNTDVQIAHQNHQKIEDAAMAKLKPVLSDQQYKKYQQIVEAEAYARHHRAPAPVPATSP